MSSKSNLLEHVPIGVAALSEARPNRFLTGLAMMVSDVLALILASLIGIFVWAQFNPGVRDLYYGMWPAIIITVIVFACKNLYPPIGLNEVEQLRSMIIGISAVYFGTTVMIFLSKDFTANSRGVFVTSWILSTILVPTTRAITALWSSKQSWWGVPVLVLGTGTTAEAVISKLHRHPALGLRPIGCLGNSYEVAAAPAVPYLGPVSLASKIAASAKVDYAIVAMNSMPREELIPLLRHLSTTFHDILLIPDLFGSSSLWVSPRDLDGILGLQFRHNLLNRFNRFLKRSMDIAVALLGLLISSPIIAVAFVWIKLVSPGKAFFIQERDGERCSMLHVIKLRTMYLDAEALLEKHLDSNPDARNEWEQFCKLKNDPRVLPGIGRILRRSSLDELPQLWNVLIGEMSLVGPRPFPAYHNERFDPDFRTLRTQVKPGLTGLWQVSARSNGDLTVQATLDTYYIQNWSVWLDFYILIRTAKAVLFPSGAY